MSDLAERYLKRLGIDRPITLDWSSLKLILEAHLRAIPFEDVTSFLGSPVSLVPDEVFDKLLEGFKVEPILARVYTGPGSDKVMAQTHAVTAVTLDGKQYVFDPGCGADTPSIPVCIDSGDAAQQGQWGTYRIRLAADAANDVGPKMGADVTKIMESKSNGVWTSIYGLTRPPVILADVEAFNWYVSTSPASFFTKKLTCARWDGDRRITGFDKRFKHHTPGGVTETELKTREDVDHWLRIEMRLNLTDEQISAVWDKLNAEGE